MTVSIDVVILLPINNNDDNVRNIKELLKVNVF